MSSEKTKALSYAVIVALGGFIFGLDAAVISGTVKYISQEFLLSDLQLGFVVSAPGLSVLPALPLAGYFSNRFGRKKALQVVAFLYLVSAISSALAPGFITLVLARFIGGIAFCSLSLSAMYIGEIAPPKLRGKLVALNQINIVLGLAVAYFLNYLIVLASESETGWINSLGIDQHPWRWMLGAEVIPALLWFLLLFRIPESPSWLVFKNRITDAKTILLKILPKVGIEHHISEMQKNIQQSIRKLSIWVQLKQILGKPMRLALIIGVTIGLAQQLTGINAILFYAPTVFEQLGIGTNAAFAQAIWVGLTSLVFTILALLLIDKIGRRPLVIWGLAWMVLSLGICAYGFKTARYELPPSALHELQTIENIHQLKPIVGKEFDSDKAFKDELIRQLGEEQARKHSSAVIQKAAKINVGLILFGILSFIAAFQFSVGPVMWVLFSEIFPISLRGIAIPFFAFLNSLSSYIVQLFFPWQLSNMGASGIFISYATMGIIGLIILYRYLPETKNMSIEEIHGVLS